VGIAVRIPTYSLAAWTLFVWLTRMRNAAGADEALTAYILPVVLVVLACMALAAPRRWGPLLAIVASAVWLVRVPMILVADHDLPFKVVHTMLAVITWALAAWTVRSSGAARRGRPVRVP
jgi:hypothetical protein